jgi:hypothetical protein
MRPRGTGSSRATEAAHPSFRYVRAGNYYINTSLRLPLLTQYLWRQFEQFLGSEGKSRLNQTRLSWIMPPVVTKATRVSKIVVRFLVAQLVLAFKLRPTGNDVMTLGVPGEFLIVRKSGAVKVLDIKRRVVHTIMKSGDREKLAERVRLSSDASRFPFAPRIENVDLEDGHYSEEFISGSHPLDFEGCQEDFVSVYRPLLVEFLRALRPEWRPLRAYVDSLMEQILARDGLLLRLDEEVRAPVVAFVEEVGTRLRALDGQIPLVLSHGDFFSGNIVIDGGRHRAIDWANMGQRSPLHDLYYLQMNHCRRVLDHDGLWRRLRAAIGELREALRSEARERFDELIVALTSGDEYRHLFYLECIQVPLVRCDSVEDRYLESMLVRVSWFSEFERYLAHRGPIERPVPGPGSSATLKRSEAGNR